MWRTCVGLAVVVGCGSPSPGGVTLLAPDAPEAVIAYRIGEGAWTVTSGASTPLVIPVTEGLYTVAVECSTATYIDIYVLDADDVDTLTYDHACATSAPVISGALGSLGPDGNIRFGWGEASSVSVGQGRYSIAVPAGKHDLAMVRGDLAPDRIVLVRDLAVTSNVTQDIDFASGDAIPVQMTAIGPPLTVGHYASELYTRNGTQITLSDSSHDQVPYVPDGALQAGDLQVFTMVDTVQGNFRPVTWVSHASMKPPSALSLPPVASTSATMTKHLVGSFPIVSTTWSKQQGAVAYELFVGNWDIRASAAAFDEMQSTLAMPDLTAVAGWTLPAPSTAWGMYALVGEPLDETLRDVPTREEELRYTGWAGTDATP